jgi:acetolactate synthase-1/2/3 large subunit
MKLADYVIEFIAGQGVNHIFLLPGGGCMHLVDSVGRCPDLEYVCNLHEQASAVAADAYAQYSNNLGVALVTTGPGGTNTITGLAGAWLDSTPCLFLSGQVKRADIKGGRGVRQLGFQEIDTVTLVRSITKYAVTVMDPASIRYHLERAVHVARSGRPGPVWIDIPLDVQAAAVEPDGMRGFDAREVERPFDERVLKAQVAESIRLLNEAERPVLLLGNGVRLARAQEEFRRLAEILDVPVLTTWKALDMLPEEHPLYVGRPGSIGQRGANFAQQNSDWFLSLGARLDFGQTGYNHANFARAAQKIIVDVDRAEIEKLEMPIAVPCFADARLFIQEMLEQRASLAQRDRRAWWERCREWKRRYPVVVPDYWESSDYVNNYVLMDALSEEMSPNDLMVPGSSGACSEVTMQAFRVKQGMRVFNTEGLGPMGFGIAAAIGGCLASGRRRTVSVDGDGGFHMNAQELATVRRLNLPIKFFVLNNNGYASIRATQQNYFAGRFVASGSSSGLTLPDTVGVARACGLCAARLETQANIRAEVRKVLESDGPIVCDVRVATNQATAPRLSSYQRADGSMASRPLEDLWPFLDRDEFLANMVIPPVEE